MNINVMVHSACFLQMSPPLNIKSMFGQEIQPGELLYYHHYQLSPDIPSQLPEKIYCIKRC